MKVALVCDWLTNFAGSEQVLLALWETYPHAPIFTGLYHPKKVPQFQEAKIYPSFLQKIPGAKNHHQIMFPLMPLAFENFDFSEFEVVISSSHNCAKGIITKPSTLHICYCHTPIRYLWSHHHEYLKESPFNFLVKRAIPYLSHYLRVWDFLAAQRVDLFVANSENTRRRIKKYYQKEAVVIYPPVNTAAFKISPKISDYYLVVGRLVPYKRVDIIVQAFNDLKLPLKICGEGPEDKRLRRMARSNIEFLGRLPDNQLKKLYSQAKAFIFAAEEDFGIVPLEAMASGRPVIAYQAGGALESVVEGITGIFFKEQTPQCLVHTIRKFNPQKYDPFRIRQHALKFDVSVFKKQIKQLVEKSYQEHLKAYAQK